MILPADSHVYSEWSWDTGGPTSAAAGRMELMCALAVRIGLPAVVFTEHVDFDDAWRTTRENVMPHQQSMLDPGGYLRPPPLETKRSTRGTSVACVPQCATCSNLADLGRTRCAPTEVGGELLGRFMEAGREATRNVYGVLVAMPQGHSWAPTSSSESQ